MHIILPALLLYSAPAHAGGGFVAGSINLVLFVGVLILVAKTPIKKMLKRRANTIKRELEEAHQQLEEAKAHNKEVEEKLAQLQDQIASMQKDADLQLEKMKEHVYVYVFI